MPKLTDKQLADLMREMPDASDEEIVAEAKKREAAGAEPSLFQRLTTPLTTLPSKVAKAAGDFIDQRSLDESPTLARLKGFAAGALEGAGNVASSMTSPLDLALTLVGAGGAAAGRKGLLGISKGARALEAGLNAPVAIEGAREVAEGVSEGDFGKIGAGALMGTMGAAGMTTAARHAFPPQKVMEAYMASKGRPLVKEPRVEKLDTAQSMKIADAYEAMPHAPEDPAVKNSYQAMAKETSDQFEFLRDRAGVRMEPWTKEGQPYANSQEMMDDVRKNNRLFFFPSEGGFGSVEAQGGNPLLKPGASGAPVNDEFRAIHDYFGHAVEGNQFGPLGEERAYRSHVRMFPDEARPAMTTETRGQNSWVNFGRHLRNADGSVPKKGEPGFVAPQDRPFAEQKTGLLPEEFVHRPAAGQPSPQTAAGAQHLQDPAGIGATPRTDASSASGSVGASPQGKFYTPDEATVNIAELHSKDGGSTFNLQKGSLSGTPHYAVSIYPERGVTFPGKDLPPAAFKQFIEQNADLLADPRNSVGTWFNPADGKTYLDVSVTLPDLDDALRLGAAKGQLAIFDLKNFETIPVSGQPSMPAGAMPDTPLARQMAGTSNPEFHSVHPEGTATVKGGKTFEGKGGEVVPLPRRDATLDAMQKVEEARAARREAEGRGPGSATALALAAPAASMAIPDDPDSQLDDYGRVALGILGGAGLLGAAVRGRGAPILTPQMDAAHKGAAALWLGGRKAFAQAAGEHANPQTLAASQKILENHLKRAKLPKTNHLLKMMNTGKADLKWYDETGKELRAMFGPDAELVAKFIAATSNNTTVPANATLALKALWQHKAGLPFEGYVKVVRDNLARAQTGELTGRKVDNFVKALMGDENAVVVDKWMMRAFGFPGDAPSDAQYEFIENAVKQFAAQQGVTPRQAQAAIWFGKKNPAEVGKNRPASPPLEVALKDSITRTHDKALKENRKFDKERAKGLRLPFGDS